MKSLFECIKPGMMTHQHEQAMRINAFHLLLQDGHIQVGQGCFCVAVLNV